MVLFSFVSTRFVDKIVVKNGLLQTTYVDNPFIQSTTYSSNHPSFNTSIHLPIHPCTHPFIHPAIHPPIHIFTHISNLNMSEEKMAPEKSKSFPMSEQCENFLFVSLRTCCTKPLTAHLKCCKLFRAKFKMAFRVGKRAYCT